MNLDLFQTLGESIQQIVDAIKTNKIYKITLIF